jgi:hypothetical protein
MAMPRPSGKALKIAKEVVPGLPQHLHGASSKKGNPVADNYESTIIEINENRGRLPYKPKNKGGAPGLSRWDFRSAGYA